MIVIKRNNEVVIEDGYERIVVREDGGGFIHGSSGVAEVDLLSPLYLKEAKRAGLDISDEAIVRSAAEVDQAFGS